MWCERFIHIAVCFINTKNIPLYGYTSIVLIYSSCMNIDWVVLTFQLLWVITQTFYTHDIYKLFLGTHVFISPEEISRSGLLNCGPGNLDFTFYGIWVVFQSGYTIGQFCYIFANIFVLICDFSCHNRCGLVFLLKHFFLMKVFFILLLSWKRTH